MALFKRGSIVRRLALGLLLYPLSRLWPRSSKRWVFGHAGELFAGNPKYLFLWMRVHRPDLSVTWITGSSTTLALLRRHGLPARSRWSALGILSALRSGLFVFAHDPADINLPLSRGARHINLWHGVGVKALHTGAKPAPSKLWGWLRRFVYVPYDIIVTTSDMMQAHFAQQFRLPLIRCPQLGYPRLDCGTDARLEGLASDIDLQEGFRLKPSEVDEVYIYMPTFRDSRPAFLDEALPNLMALNDVLGARGALLYVKPHPRTSDINLNGLEWIKRWPNAIDIYTHLAEFDCLITDYSSVLYDYIYAKHTGVILYTFDIDQYLAQDRAMAHDYARNVTGVRVSSFEDLCSLISEGSALSEDLSDDIDALRERFWGGSPQPSSAAVVRYLEDEVIATALLDVR